MKRINPKSDNQQPVLRQKDNVPGGIYLCQVDKTVSCAACCGLYNLADASRQRLYELLNDRTDTYTSLARGMDTILEFGRKITAQTTDGRPFPDFHHCPFIGLIGTEKSRVGCLLHPLNRINKGIDYRGLSYYGGLACEVYFCPASRLLSPALKTMLKETAGDWYDYGLVVTEEKLLNGFISRVEAVCGRPLAVDDLSQNDRYPDIVKKLLSLKQSWPHRRRPDPGPCNYFFNDQRYRKPPVDYVNVGGSSPYNDIFRELNASFDSPGSLKEGEDYIQDLIDELVRAFRK